jgi:hypothetical protein
MAKSVQYTVNPKTIDESDNETDLTQYTVTNTYDMVVNYNSELPNGDKYIVLPTLDNHKVIELRSDQKITFQILTDGVVTITLSDVEYVNMSWGEVQNYTYQVKNISGSNANIFWYEYA